MLRTGTVPSSAIMDSENKRLDAGYWLKECCVSCGRFIDGEDVKMGVKVEGTGKMCLNCYEKQMEKSSEYTRVVFKESEKHD